MIEKRIGKIQTISFGLGGYQDACLGISLQLGSEKQSWGVGDFKGTWAMKPSESAQWTTEDQTRIWGEMCRWVAELLESAKVASLDKLVGIPVEIVFDGMKLKSWRILEEAI